MHFVLRSGDDGFSAAVFSQSVLNNKKKYKKNVTSVKHELFFIFVFVFYPSNPAIGCHMPNKRAIVAVVVVDYHFARGAMLKNNSGVRTSSIVTL